MGYEAGTAHEGAVWVGLPCPGVRRLWPLCWGRCPCFEDSSGGTLLFIILMKDQSQLANLTRLICLGCKIPSMGYEAAPLGLEDDEVQ